MDFKQLTSFVEVVRRQSFTDAAGHLFLSQPTVSAHVRQLEEELGRELISRTTKSIEVTAKGREVYDYAVSILDLRDRMIETCTLTEQKTIHLGASTIPSAYILPEVLPEFGRMYPDIYFAIHQSDSQGIVDGLKDGLFDLGLIGMKVDDEAVRCEAFCEDHMVLITPVSDRYLELKRRGHVPLRELLSGPIIMREKGSGSKKTADRFLERMGISEEDLSVVARLNDQEAIKKLVAGGLGISIISEMAAKNYLSEKRILSFPLHAEGSNRNLYLISRSHDVTQPHVEQLIRYLKKHYAGGEA